MEILNSQIEQFLAGKKEEQRLVAETADPDQFQAVTEDVVLDPQLRLDILTTAIQASPIIARAGFDMKVLLSGYIEELKQVE